MVDVCRLQKVGWGGGGGVVGFWECRGDLCCGGLEIEMELVLWHLWSSNSVRRWWK